MRRLPDPQILIAIKDLQLAAKTTIDGFMSGINKSTIKGEGLEFNQYRSYQPGDDLRQLDWKMFARSDRYYIRESEIETSIAIRIVIDASASMNHLDSAYPKIEYASYLAASLGWLANLQGDAVGLSILYEKNIQTLIPARGHQHLSRFYYQLEQIRPSGHFTQPLFFKEILPLTAKRELLVFISDFYDQDGQMIKLLESLVGAKHELIVFHLMGQNEMHFDYKGYAALEDMETGEKIQLNKLAQTDTYQQRLASHLDNIRTRLLIKNIHYRLLTMEQPLDIALRDFLNQRIKTIR